MSRVLTLVLASVCLVGAQQQRPPVFRGSTDIAHLDVMVTNKDGQHVVGLTKDDFELYLDHARVTVDVLAENRHARGEGPAARRDVVTNETVQGDRIVMFVLDDLHIPKERVGIAREAAERFVNGIAGRAEVAVLFTSGQPGLELTRDPDLLLDTVRKLRGNQNPFMKVDASTWPSPIQHMDPANRPGGGGSSGSASTAAAGADRARNQAENDLFWSTMQGALDKLPKHDGRRKAIVMLSEGNVVSSATGQLANTPSATDTDYSAAIPEAGMYTAPTPGGTNRLLGNFINSVRRTETSVHAIDPRGKATMGQEGYAPGATFLNDGDIARQRQSSLRRYTDQTGGFAIVDTNDLATGVERVITDLDNYYTLGFRLPNPDNTSIRTVEVRVKRPGLEVRHRQMYQWDNSLPKGPRPTDPLAALATSPMPTGDLPLRLWGTVLAPTSPGGQPRVALWLESPTGPILEYGVYPFDVLKKKEAGKPLARTMRGIVPNLIPIECPPLAPGRYQLRVTARSTSAGGSAYLTIDVPSFSAQRVAVSGLLIGRVGVRRADMGPLAFAPTLERTFDARTTLRVGFDVWQRDVRDPATASVVVLDAGGREVSRSDRTMEPGASRRVDAEVPLAGAAAGPHTLQVTVTVRSDSARATIAFDVK